MSLTYKNIKLGNGLSRFSQDLVTGFGFSAAVGLPSNPITTGTSMNDYIYTQGDSGEICNTLGNDSMCDSKQKIHMNMGPILNGYRDMVKRSYGPSCQHEQQLRNK